MKEKTRRILLVLVEWTWCLPQNLLGTLLLPLAVSSKKELGPVTYREWRLGGGISLGSFIYIQKYPTPEREKAVLLHEYGHFLQSLYLGPLYLVLVGLPSFLWATLYTLPFVRRKKSYYYFYTEAWANHLSGRKH